MAMSNAAVAFMTAQGYDDLESLRELNDDTIQSIEDRAGSQWIPNPAGAGVVRGPPIDFSVRAFQRFKIFVKGLKFYNAIGRGETAPLVRFRMMEIILDQFDVLEKTTAEELPKMRKNEDPIHFMSRFKNYLGSVKSVRKVPVPISYVIRTEADVPAAAPPLALNMPYSEEHGSIENEMIERVAHDSDDPFFTHDNTTVFRRFRAALQNSPLLSTIIPFARTRDGRGAVLAFMAQHCGVAKHEIKFQSAETLLRTMKYTWRNPSFTLGDLANSHRIAYSEMDEAVAAGVRYQLPYEGTRARYFINTIDTNDAGLLCTLNEYKYQASGVKDSFEGTVAYLMPKCPAAKLKWEQEEKLRSRKRPNARISETLKRKLPRIKR